MGHRYKGRYYSPKRRAIYAQGDAIDALTLFNLHDWVCNICQEAIDPLRRFPDRLAATVEHVVPLCKGGTHTWDNVRPAHAACNWAKGDRLDIEASGVVDLPRTTDGTR